MSSGFLWNVEEDFKAVPETWIPAHGVKRANGHPLPDEHGHIPGEMMSDVGPEILRHNCRMWKVLLNITIKSVESMCVCGCSGWVPVQKTSKQYCWHSSVLDHKMGKALVLRPSADDGDGLEISAVPLGDLVEQTLELIGTNVNGNPYGNVSKASRFQIWRKA